MKRPSVEASLKPLKPFQRRTVDHAFHRLFTAKDGTGRFLVADEVGLGKTLVARGIIAKAIDHLWNDVERIDIVYICSNASIARANLPKLQVGGAEERSFALATRLTMLATELARRQGESGLAGSKLNFVSFTPGTSFNLGSSAGRGPEREVLFQLIDPLMGPRTALMNLLQGGIVKRDEWRRRLKNDPRLIDGTIRKRFNAAFRERPDLQGRLRELLDTWFRRYRRWPAEARHPRDRIISELRRLLAGACVHALEPDLVILDEFQRFKSLLDTQGTESDAAAGLAQELFRVRAHDGKRVRTLLLSATPYKLYTADAEIEHEDHYEDFLATTRFLLGDDDTRVEELQQQLSRFGAALRRAAAGEPDQVKRVEQAKGAVEGSLRDVMARTERVAASDDRDAMVAEDRRTTPVTASDVRQYPRRGCAIPRRQQPGSDAVLEVGAVSPALHARLQIPRSPRRGARHGQPAGQDCRCAPAPRCGISENGDAAVMGKPRPRARQAARTRRGADRRETLATAVDAADAAVLAAGGTIRRQGASDETTAVLGLERGAGRRQRGPQLRGGTTDGGRPARVLRQPRKSSRGLLLKLSQSTSAVRSRHRLFLLLLPCLPLADRAHPLAAPPSQDRRAWTRAQVDDLLTELPNRRDGSIDDRWEWAAPLLLDPELPAFLRAWRDRELPGASDGEPLPRPNPDVFACVTSTICSR